MNNLVVQLLLKTGTFSTDLKQAGGQIQSFKSGCQTAGKTVDAFGKALGLNIGSLAKLGTAAGVAVAAVKGFKAVMESTQTTADAMEGAIAGCKGVIEAFKVSIATADFSAFSNGLWSVFDAAKAARDALDDLQDAQIAYGYKSSRYRKEFNEAITILKDPTSTEEQKKAAMKDAETALKAQEDVVDKYARKNLNDTRAAIRAKLPYLNENDINYELVERALDIKLAENTKELEQANKAEAKRVKKVIKQYGKNNVTGRDAYIRQNSDALILDILAEMKTEDLKRVVAEGQEVQNAKDAVISMRKTYNKAISPEIKKTVTSTTHAVKEQIVVQEESYEWWQKIAQEAKKHRDAEVYDSDAWHRYNNDLTTAESKLEEINEQIAKLKRQQQQQKYGDLLTPITGPNLTGQVTNTNPAGLAETNKKTFDSYSINELKAQIDAYTELAANVKGNTELMSHYNSEIEKRNNRIKELESLGIKSASIKPETIDSWSEFNNTMSQTSTIVSSLTSTFQTNTKLTTSSILAMVSTALPALGSLIASIDALTTAEAVEAGVAATGKAVSTSKHWIEAIAAVAALGATVAAAIAAAKSNGAKKYATGGIVGGSSFTGDRVTAQVNSGEMILNKSQQARLFSLANGNGIGNGQVTFHISGTDLVGVLNNYTRKSRVIR